jgi:hypothetical protein
MKPEEYLTDIFVPLAKAHRKYLNDDSGFARHFRNKIYRHACYALDDFNNYRKLYASKAAQAEFRKTNRGMIHDNDVSYVSILCKGNKVKKYHYEHVFTNSMLINLIEKGHLTIDRIKRIINSNFCTAWILREENNRLTENKLKSNRGDTLKKALQKYREMGIHLIDRNGKIVN